MFGPELRISQPFQTPDTDGFDVAERVDSPGGDSVSRSLQEEESTLSKRDVQRAKRASCRGVDPTVPSYSIPTLNHLLVSGPLPLIFCVCVADTT